MADEQTLEQVVVVHGTADELVAAKWAGVAPLHELSRLFVALSLKGRVRDIVVPIA